nr:MAG TPA: hypothetical protein [Caudoviricetes sp.]
MPPCFSDIIITQNLPFVKGFFEVSQKNFTILSASFYCKTNLQLW